MLNKSINSLICSLLLCASMSVLAQADADSPAKVIAIKEDSSWTLYSSNYNAEVDTVKCDGDNVDLSSGSVTVSSSGQLSIESTNGTDSVTFNTRDIEVVPPGSDGFWYREGVSARIVTSVSATGLYDCFLFNSGSFTSGSKTEEAGTTTGTLEVQRNGMYGVGFKEDNGFGYGEMLSVDCYDTAKPKVEWNREDTATGVEVGKATLVKFTPTDKESGVDRIEAKAGTGSIITIGEDNLLTVTKNMQYLVTVYDKAGNSNNIVVNVNWYKADAPSSSSSSSSSKNNNSSSSSHNNKTSVTSSSTEKKSGSWDNYWKENVESSSKAVSNSSKAPSATTPAGYKYTYKEPGVEDVGNIDADLAALAADTQNSNTFSEVETNVLSTDASIDVETDTTVTDNIAVRILIVAIAAMALIIPATILIIKIIRR